MGRASTWGRPPAPWLGTVELTRALPFVPFLVAGGLATAVFGGHLAPPLRALLVWVNG